MGLLFFYLALALGVSFLCSILEAVLLSTPLTYIAMSEKEGETKRARQSARIFRQFKENIDRPISAILSLNTIAHTIGAAGVGAQATSLFGEVYFGIISAALTLLILVVSEIIPKTIGARYCRALSLPAARVMSILITLCYPLVWLSELITRTFARKEKEAAVSREEVSAMIEAGAKEGVIHSKENRIFQNIIKMEKVGVREVMTPRGVCAVARENLSLKDFFADQSLQPYSRIPLYAGEKDNITGYVLCQDVLSKLAEDSFSTTLTEIKRPIMALSEKENVSAAWEKLLSNKEHISLVVDEYGTFEGLITMEDIVETILGLEIMDEKDTVADMQQLAREKWKERARKYKQFSMPSPKILRAADEREREEKGA